MIDVLAKTFLQFLYNEDKCYVELDDPSTTGQSCGATILALIIGADGSAETAARLTGLPETFTAAVLSLLWRGHWWYSAQFGDLVSALHDHGGTLEQIRMLVSNTVEVFWLRTDCNSLADLQDLRQGYLLGGVPQWWTDREFLPMQRVP